MKEELDGQIYINESDLPKTEKTIDDLALTETGESHPFEIDHNWLNKKETTTYIRKLARWKDVTTLPKMRTKCVKMCSTKIPPIKFCCGWKNQFKWLYRSATLIVSTKTPVDIKKAIDECLKSAVVIAALTAIISGGSAAIQAAEKAFLACLTAKLGSNLVDVKIKTSSAWGKWV